ncbi:19564_t:CDS:1 [Funneliformis geosporum]|uniref:3342_t:CDS:1 n=1 Tax=Funneliformis geosporum TaxID=1117311 RepID=A0A9W4SNG5_9GLOM|nr:3342_t:CDS:1 [Funneliformis geosporum]CAI2177026.1 19564_t:CDS:1 [Funneliformis geosporum]
MFQKSSLHYYEDGDIILIVQDTAFCLHRNYLSMASKVFRDMLSCVTSSTDKDLSRINITDTSPLLFEQFLTFIYPQKFVPITWDIISEFCQIGDKYEFATVLGAAEYFLESHFHEKPLSSLILADRYHFKFIYKESSKLVLNRFQEYRQHSKFLLLSHKTKSALFEKYLDFTISIKTICSLKIHKDFQHHSVCRLSFLSYTSHEHEIDKWYESFLERCRFLNSDTLLSPSKSMNVILKHMMEFWRDYMNRNWSECEYRFFNDYLSKQFIGHFGNFEPLKFEKSKRDAEHYIFIELKD